jgi:copper chaperone
MEAVTLSIPNISCDHCIQTIKGTATALPGVHWISGDIDAKTVRLEYDPQQTSLQQIEDALEEEEYPVAKP